MKNVEWLKDAVFYEIYPQSFFDTNQDGIGDLQGIIKKLDYVRGIGCNAIWLNPCFDSPFKDAGYDVRDYKKIAPRYGTNEDLQELVRQMHQRDMHLLLDLVPCHTSEEHRWFLESCKQEKNSFSERYIWTDGAFNKPANLTAVGGECERNGTYVISFFNCQPSLNYGFSRVTESWQHKTDSKEAIDTQDAIIDVMRFWLSMGVDGFRVDMAACLVKNDDNEVGTQAAWKRMFEIIRKEYKDAVFVSEWSHPTRALKCGFNMDFYLDHGWDGGNGYHHLLRDQDINLNTYEIKEDKSYFKTESLQSPMPFLKEYLKNYEQTKADGYISFITDNHDMIRTTKFFTESEIRLIYAFIFTMPGVPFLYYGDEIGMRYLEIPTKEGGYHRTGSRTPMQWNHSKNLGFSEGAKASLYLPVDETADAPTVEDALKNPNSLYYHVQKLIALRHEHKDLQSVNNFEVFYAEENSKLFAYKRGEFIVILNPSYKQHSLDVIGNYQIVYAVGNISQKDGGFILGAQSFILGKEV